MNHFVIVIDKVNAIEKAAESSEKKTFRYRHVERNFRILDCIKKASYLEKRQKPLEVVPR